ncbi:MAG: HAD family hydrolase [Candidatus Azotimanducaceae bacterium WSBS_2022_MAG_OTU7]
MFTTILFDLDNTLIDREETMARFLSRQHCRFAGRINCPPSAFIENVLKNQKGGYEEKRIAYEKSLEELGCDLSITDDLIKDFHSLYGDDAVFLPNVSKTLATLKNSFKLGLITNGRSGSQRRKLASMGASDLFDAIVVSGEIGLKKPDPRIFEHCLDLVSPKASESVYVGDNPTADIEPASRLGMKAIWMQNDNFSDPNCEHDTIMGISELTKLIGTAA